jgi:hypothetical protein
MRVGEPSWLMMKNIVPRVVQPMNIREACVILVVMAHTPARAVGLKWIIRDFWVATSPIARHAVTRVDGMLCLS